MESGYQKSSGWKIFRLMPTQRCKSERRLEVMPPAGKFHTELNNEHAKNYVLFAAGSGITPVLINHKNHTVFTEPKSTVTLIYGNGAETQ